MTPADLGRQRRALAEAGDLDAFFATDARLIRAVRGDADAYAAACSAPHDSAPVRDFGPDEYGAPEFGLWGRG